MAKNTPNTSNFNKNSFKEPEWIDLDEESLDDIDSESEDSPAGSASRKRTTKKTPASAAQAAKKRPSSSKRTGEKKTKINFHVILLSLMAVVFVIIAFKLIFWDKRVRENNERENDNTLSFDTEPLDSIVPLDSSDNSKKEKDDDLRILFLGNGSLAEDKTSDTNLANIVQAKTGATVYNCAIPGTYMSMKNSTYKDTFSYDAFSFYYLCTVFTVGNTKTLSWAERDLGGFPQDVKESLDLLQSIDYDELDILCVYYDGSDCLDQRESYNAEKLTQPDTFYGALSAGLDLVQQYHPHVRIIVMSPSYAYAVDENGNYTSSFLTDILNEPLTIYVGLESRTCMEHRVSFVDNLYGSIYEEIADDYLKDNILLNDKGNALLADRFLYALNRFNDYDFPS